MKERKKEREKNEWVNEWMLPVPDWKSIRRIPCSPADPEPEVPCRWCSTAPGCPPDCRGASPSCWRRVLLLSASPSSHHPHRARPYPLPPRRTPSRSLSRSNRPGNGKKWFSIGFEVNVREGSKNTSLEKKFILKKGVHVYELLSKFKITTLLLGNIKNS